MYMGQLRLFWVISRCYTGLDALSIFIIVHFYYCPLSVFGIVMRFHHLIAVATISVQMHGIKIVPLSDQIFIRVSMTDDIPDLYLIGIGKPAESHREPNLHHDKDYGAPPRDSILLQPHQLHFDHVEPQRMAAMAGQNNMKSTVASFQPVVYLFLVRIHIPSH